MNKVILGDYCAEFSRTGGCDCNKFAGNLDQKNYGIVKTLIPAHDKCDCQAVDDVSEEVVIKLEDMDSVTWAGYNWIPIFDFSGDGKTYIRGEALTEAETAEKLSQWNQFVIRRDAAVEKQDGVLFETWVREHIANILARLDALKRE